MVQRRIIYLTVLLGSLVFFWAYRQWLSGLLLMLVLLTPWLSLLLSLPAMLSCRVQLQCPTVITVGAGAAVSCDAKSKLPLPEIRGKFTAVWSFDGKKRKLRFGEVLKLRHCGAVKLHRCRIRICDYLGLFALPKGKKQDRVLLVRPHPLKPATMPDLSRFLSSITRPKAGGGYAENHELRLYRPGDNLHQIHWKLSAKTGNLMIREPMEPASGAAMLTMDLYGTPKILDEKLGRLLWMSQYLAQQQIKHRIFCMTGSGVKQFLVTNETEVQDAVDELLQCRVLTEETEFVYPKAVWRYHIGGGSHES